MKYLLYGMIFAYSSINATTLYIVSPMAKLLDEPNMSAKGVLLKKGVSLKQIGEKDMFYKVTFMNKTGWISKVFVSRQPLLSTNGVFYEKKEQEENKVKPRARASSYHETYAARGKVKSEKIEINTGNKSDYDFESIKWLDEQKVTKKDLNKFFKEK